MSASPSDDIATAQTWANEIDCPHRPVRVEVERVEIPVSLVRTELTKEGPANVNRLTEVYFPGEFMGQDVTQYINSFDPSSQSDYDKVRVLWKPNDADEDAFETVQFGYVRGVAGTDTAGELRMWVSDPSTLTTAIPYTGGFEDGADVQTALNDVIHEFEQESVFDFVGVDILSSIVRQMGVGSQSFTGNRDTIKDALDYIAESTQSWWYFDWSEGGPILVLDSTPLRESPGQLLAELSSDPNEGTVVLGNEGVQSTPVSNFEERLESIPRTRTTFASKEIDVDAIDGGIEELLYSDAGVDDEVTVLDNDAINEILPINTLRANGKTSTSQSGVSFSAPSQEWPSVKVRYEPLYERANGNEYHASIQETDTKTITETKRVAKSKLKKALQSTGEGDMTVKGTPTIRPYDRLIALPTCGEVLNQSPPLDYEVTSVRHEADAMTGAVYRTNLDVTLFVDESQIETVEARMVSH